MTSLHPLQEKIYKIFKTHNTLPPFREIARQIGVSSTNTVSYHINELRKKGYLEITHSPQGIAKLSIKTILSLENKKGLYVLLKKKIPFYLATAENIKEDIIKNVIGIHATPIPEINEQTESITIAYHIIEDNSELQDLKKHLIDFYKSQGINLK